MNSLFSAEPGVCVGKALQVVEKTKKHHWKRPNVKRLKKRELLILLTLWRCRRLALFLSIFFRMRVAGIKCSSLSQSIALGWIVRVKK